MSAAFVFDPFDYPTAETKNQSGGKRRTPKEKQRRPLLFAATEMVKQPLVPRYNPFDWETWHELGVRR